MDGFFDTIAAIATPPGYGGISIVKMSGGLSRSLLCDIIFNQDGSDRPEITPWQIRHGYVKDPSTGVVIDEVLVFFMKGPKSSTGEDVAEIHCHGGPVTAYRVLTLLISHGARMAAPGEFTRRAFLNGKIDLTRAEAIESIIHAKTVFQQENALVQLEGRINTIFGILIDELRTLTIRIEAELNFPEEMDAKPAKESAVDLFEKFDASLAALEKSFDEGRPFFEGIRALIIGKPNTGKSSFLNELLEYDRAIVSHAPGTTRDFIEGSMILEGLPVRLVDTAGIRETSDDIERQGIAHTMALLPEAQVVFAVFDGSSQLDDDDRRIITAVSNNHSLNFVLLNKSDLGSVVKDDVFPSDMKISRLSLLTGAGVSEFRQQFRAALGEIYNLNNTREYYLTNPRHQAIVKEMRSAVSSFRSGDGSQDMLLFTARELLALFDRLMGKDVSQDELNKIFDRFCIGK